MFTGLISELGSITAIDKGTDSAVCDGSRGLDG